MGGRVRPAGVEKRKAKPFTCTAAAGMLLLRAPWIHSELLAAELEFSDVGILLTWSRPAPLIGGAARCSHLCGGRGRGREKGSVVLLQKPDRNMVISTTITLHIDTFTSIGGGCLLWALNSFQASFCPHVEKSDTRPSYMTCLPAFIVWPRGRTSKTAPLEATTVHLGLWVICTCERSNVKSLGKKNQLCGCLDLSLNW